MAESAPPEWAAPVDGNVRAAVAEFLKNILDFLVAVREMAELYVSRDMLNAHRGIWTVMSAAQQPV